MARPRGRARLVAIGLLPWLWFAVRDLHPYTDAVALGWPLIAGLAIGPVLLAGLLARRRAPVLIAVAWTVAAFVVIAGPWLPRRGPAPSPAIEIVAANAYSARTDPTSIASEISLQEPDLVVVSEMGPALQGEMMRRFPHYVGGEGTYAEVVTTGVFSRWPVTTTPLPGLLRAQRGLRAEVATPAGPVVVYALHLDKPGIPPLSSPEVGLRTHRRIVDALVEVVEGEELPVLVAGDLNLIDRAGGYRALTGVLDDAMRSGWGRPTSLRAGTRPLLARVDHIFVSERWCSAGAHIFTLTGSDHLGVATRAGPCP